MSSSPTQEILDRIDRLHLMLVNDVPSLSSHSFPAPTTTPLLPPEKPNSALSMNHLHCNAFHSTLKSDSMMIDELQQYIAKMEHEREILLRSYGIILQLLKSNHSIHQLDPDHLDM